MSQSSHSTSLKKKFKSAVKSIDNYGVPIYLTYRNNHKFNTLPGGLLTIFSRLTILLFFVVQIPEVVNKNKTVTYKTVRINVDNDNDPYYFTLDNFDIAARVFSPYGQLSQDMLYNRSKYFKFEFSSFDMYPEVNGNVTNIITKNSIFELGSCSIDRLGNLTDQTKGLQLSSQAWACPKTINQKLLGSPFTQKRTTLKFRVVPCNQAIQAGIPDDGVTCASDEEIEKAIQTHFIQVVYLIEYFDENEFERSPIKKEIKNIMQNIAPNTSFFKANLYQRVNITTKDSWFSETIDNKQYSYLESVDATNGLTGYTKPGVHDMITYIFSKYQRENVITRKVTSLMDILSTTGGLSAVIMFTSLLIAKLFQHQLYEQSLVKTIFKEQEAAVNFGHELINNNNTDRLAHLIMKDIQTRKTPSIFYRQYIKETMKSFLKCWTRNKQIKHSQYNKFTTYTKHLHNTIDIVSLIKNVSLIQIMQEMLFSNHQKKLIPFLDANIIRTSDQQSPLQRKHTLANDQIFSIIQKITQNLHKRKKDRIFVSHLINEDIDQSKPKDQSPEQVFIIKGNELETFRSSVKVKSKSKIKNRSIKGKDRKAIGNSLNESKRIFLKTQVEDYNE